MLTVTTGELFLNWASAFSSTSNLALGWRADPVLSRAGLSAGADRRCRRRVGGAVAHAAPAGHLRSEDLHPVPNQACVISGGFNRDQTPEFMHLKFLGEKIDSILRGY